MGNAEVKDFAPVQAHERKVLNLSRKVNHKQFLKHVHGEFDEGCLMELPWAVRDAVSLYEQIDISFNRLSEIPVELPLRLPHICYINIGYNELESLPESFGLLFHLRVALLNNNKLKSLPESFIHLVKLEKTDLSNNSIKVLPEDLGKMETIVKINVSSNKLKKLPSSLGQSKTLEVLLAKNNPCEYPPRHLCDESSEATLKFLRKKCYPNGILRPSKVKKVNVFKRVRGNQLNYAVPNPQSALVEYIQSQTETTNIPSRIKTPLIPPIYASALDADDLKDKIIGLLYGAAIGDALGIATEGMKPDECQFHYDPENLHYTDIIRDSHRTNWKPGDWTIDFDQLALVLDSVVHWAGVVDELDLAKKLVSWNNNGFKEFGDTEGIVVCNTMTKVMSHRKFLEDPHFVAKQLVDDNKDSDAPDMFADNGSLARSIVLGIPNFFKPEELASNASRICQATHYDPRCVAASVMIANICGLLLQAEHDLKDDDSLEEMVTKAQNTSVQYLQENEHIEEFDKYIRFKDYDSVDIQEAGHVSYCLKPLACGLVALRSQKDFRSALTDIIMLGGDSNANACIAGAFLGCQTGFTNLPVPLVNGLRKRQCDWLNVRINLLLDMMGIP